MRIWEHPGHALVQVAHHRPREWEKDPKTGLLVPKTGPLLDHFGNRKHSAYDLLSYEEIWNVITNVGRAFIHTGAYATSGIQTNGLNYIALSNDTLTETASSTTLSNEIASNGLQRAQGTVVLATGAGTQTTVAKTFTATGTQSAQKGALFSASSGGTMNHVLAFTQRALANGDTLTCTWTLTIS